MQILQVHLTKLIVLLLALSSGLSWWLSPEPQAPTTAQKLTDDWRLPTISHASPDDAVDAISTANLWGETSTTAKLSLNDPEWRFSGVTSNGQERLVMISIDGQPLQTLKAGDLLPGGAKILKVNDEYLCLSIKGKKRKLDLFQ